MPTLIERLLEQAGGAIIDHLGWASKDATDLAVNAIVDCTRTRPHPFSTRSSYTSWESLTDRTYLARHLPPRVTPTQPPLEAVGKLFERPSHAQRLSSKSTCLFPAFAQYLTDGFIRTDPLNPAKTTSNHEIDLCPLYGRTLAQTRALRLMDETPGRRGRLKSQMIGGEEYPPFIYDEAGAFTDPAWEALDPPLMTPSQAAAPPWSDIPPATRATVFAVGGDRVNSTPFTAMMNTLLLREHNRVAHQLEARNTDWDDERLFQTARNILIPIFINIVVEDYINHITPMSFKLISDPSVAWVAKWNRPNWITAEFSLLYRWHSLMPDDIQWPTGPIPLGDFTLDNTPLLAVGLDAAFSAAASQKAGELGAFNTGAALQPVEWLSIRQARANQLDTYNAYRVAFGMQPAATFADITKDAQTSAMLQSLYPTPDDVEFYPGLFAEDRVPDSPLPGLLMSMVAVDAFSQALTNPLLSEHVFNADTFTPWGFDLIKSTSQLSDVLARNVPARGGTPVVMTQVGWNYVRNP
jgi:prostaglandin-endoperoxide synthase 2